MPKPIQQFVQFGPIQLPYSQLFILRRHVFATVNLKPVAPGHVLVCSKRPVKRLYDMTEVEAVEFWITVQEVAKVIKYFHNFKTNCHVSIQDGMHAGQTIPSVHCHIIPYQGKDFDILS
ncbi:unnamed protein product (macronuclear) [Paramecium tetraurelia]|uniref:HIT domain-containing protein n=1 Tax=Paramecium tetraurelia TaxID=5888 RepID=A0DVG5_PARTE|nr:uncharacterized protein GSPATT00020685001 [Paramecium tetraurelia]CAK87032.1 unnamed protein product [Paramecium tetraurelia]|eukprot:XP_001454429.1 hypothetical protein (macronuclear) [Paramecium tetraurelia strain d4-2]